MRHGSNVLIACGAMIGFAAMICPSFIAPAHPDIGWSKLLFLILTTYCYWSLIISETEKVKMAYMKLNARMIFLIVGFTSWLAVYAAHIYILYLKTMLIK